MHIYGESLYIYNNLQITLNNVQGELYLTRNVCQGSEIIVTTCHNKVQPHYLPCGRAVIKSKAWT